MAKEIIVKADKIYKRKKKYKNLKLILTVVLIFLVFVFIVLGVVYKGGSFTITLDKKLSLEKGIVLYIDPELKEKEKVLAARELNYMDNISIDWIPKNIDNEGYGSHNGENYIAYTFYIENQGTEQINYWYSVIIDDVIKNVDEAARVMIYHNGNKKVYAKINDYTGEEEHGTISFFDKENAVLEKRSDFKPGDVDKFTVVIWIEGNDPDCVDSLIGGEIKMHMEIREEYKEEDNA